MQIKTRELIIKDDDINKVRKDVLNFLYSYSYKRVLSINHIRSNLYQIVYEPVSKSVEKTRSKAVSHKDWLGVILLVSKKWGAGSSINYFE